MIKSMTGYGRAIGEFADKQITVEIRSVNNRYLDCGVKLPRLYSFAEETIKQYVKQHVTRGKVDVFVSVNLTQGTDVSVGLNRSVLEGYLAAMRQIAAEYNVRDDISVNSLSRLPDVFTVEKVEEDEDLLKNQLLTVVEQALNQYDTMRAIEGEALAKDLRNKTDSIRTMVAFVEERSPVSVQEYREGDVCFGNQIGVEATAEGFAVFGASDKGQDGGKQQIGADFLNVEHDWLSFLMVYFSDAKIQIFCDVEKYLYFCTFKSLTLWKIFTIGLCRR